MKRMMIWMGAAIGLAALLFGALSLLLAQGPAEDRTFFAQSSGTTGDGDVAIGLTPRIASGRLVVALEANTHTVDLSQFDLTSRTMLKAGGGSYAPISASSLSGHHASGEVVFDAVPEGAFTIEIVGIPAVERRTFSW